jgi:hypothetical protein
VTPPVETPTVRPVARQLADVTVGLAAALGSLLFAVGGRTATVVGAFLGPLTHRYHLAFDVLLYGLVAQSLAPYLNRYGRRVGERVNLDKVDRLRVEAWRRSGLIEP